MDTTEALRDTLDIEVSNIGGIDRANVELSDGVTVLEGENATNRTSFLQATMAAMGSDQFHLKGDADHGHVKLSLGETVVEREFNRRNGIVESSGDGLLDDPELANLFAFLLEDNEARRAVANGDDLREIITRPIDTDQIEAEIERLQAEKREIDEQIERVESRERELVDLEQRTTRLETEIEEKRDRLGTLEAEIEAADADLEEERAEKQEVEERLDELKDRRSRLEDVRFEIETAEEAVESLRAERDAKRDEREGLAGDPGEDVDALRDRLGELRDRKRRVDAQVSEIQSIVQFNEDMLDGTDSEVADVLRDGDGHDDGALTDQLLDGEESVVCWTCGSGVSRDDVKDTLDRLRSFRKEKLSARQSIQDEIDETDERVSELERAERERERVNRRLAEIDDEIERKQSRIEDLEARRDEIHGEIEALEAEVEDEEASDYGELLDLHKRANAVELEIEQKEDELASVEDEVAEIESLLGERDEYEARRDEIADRLDELRNRIDSLERGAVEEFNAHVEEVLDVLEYENVARIWIERVERETRQGRRKVAENHFELHVVRESESGRTYEGTVDTLSESEREVVGLVFALAGYLVHDLHETVPVMLLDSLEAIDSARIARLVEYFAEYPAFLVVALLPADAEAIEVAHDTVTKI
ncbi:archaea-specific SMC-related protein [Halorussus salinus]|uniref:archaea-specific SMC-related protein n=1 Tax=Halorussus salinus TaxID=1364935 RepID=UPI001091BA3F|nr:archaea-specific SMC-related protein [Halorussus salinus]